MAKTYKAVEGSSLSDKQAGVVGRQLDKLGSGFTPEQVVEAARSPDSPLHQFFEWDAKKAHGLYLVERARYLIRSVTVVITGSQSVRAYHSVTIKQKEARAGHRGYVSLEEVSHSDALRRQVIQRAIDDAKAWRARYENLRDVLGTIFSAIDSVETQFKRKDKSNGR